MTWIEANSHQNGVRQLVVGDFGAHLRSLVSNVSAIEGALLILMFMVL